MAAGGDSGGTTSIRPPVNPPGPNTTTTTTTTGTKFRYLAVGRPFPTFQNLVESRQTRFFASKKPDQGKKRISAASEVGRWPSLETRSAVGKGGACVRPAVKPLVGKPLQSVVSSDGYLNQLG